MTAWGNLDPPSVNWHLAMIAHARAMGLDRQVMLMTGLTEEMTVRAYETEKESVRGDDSDRVEPAPLSRVSESLRDELADLGGLVEALELRLRPVLRPDVAVNDAVAMRGAESDGASPLTNLLGEFTERVRATRHGLAALLDRLEV